MKKTSLISAFIFISSQIAFAQTPQPTPKPVYPQQIVEVSREKREQAFAKLLEGQRYIWNLGRSRVVAPDAALLAKQALQKAVELDPSLDEAYTAMSEVAWITWSGSANSADLDESEMLANMAVKLNRNNYGAHHRLAWIYTIKSGIRDNSLDKASAEKAITEWKELARLDPRNAEAFAFLSAFYERANKRDEQIDALKRWLAAANPVNSGFYLAIMGREENLLPESASLKLGKALLDAGQAGAAIEYLNRAIADNPGDETAIELLGEALESADASQFSPTVEALQQALYANPESTSIISLLAQTEARSGKIDNAAKVLRESIAKFSETDKVTAANLQVALGDIYADAERFDEAVSEYQNSLTTRGIEDVLVNDSDRGFAGIVYEKLIQIYKNANRPADAKNKIEQARALFGKDDLFPDKKLIDFYRETGQKTEALEAVRTLRARLTDDQSLLRTEASILTEMNKVDEGVALVKASMNKKVSETAAPQYNDFSNYIFISMLYTEAKRGKDAAGAANQAFSVAKSDEQKQFAKLSLATAQQVSGDFKGAEETLRGLLKQTPRNPIALNNLGYFFLERNLKFEEALDLISQAVKIDPTNPSYLDSLGWAYFKLGKFSEAEKYLKEASRLMTSATIFEHLGDVYQKQNKPELSKFVYQKALNLASDAETAARLKAKLNK
ncbi:MAG TPA: tetratricopeptide repeat protein [Pyrinomonadaceae bacterium]|jgi:tetratricopeptide (TPR) repeat protein